MSDSEFPASEFDEWAETYDASVDSEQFPFWLYRQTLEKVVEQAKPAAGMSVLDLGTGTGKLAELFAGRGCELWCTDFSAAMLEKAAARLPKAHFHLVDLRADWLEVLPDRFDRIVSAYVFHHFVLDEKLRILRKLTQHLQPDGKLIIADIAFPDETAKSAVMRQVGEEWDEEYYWLADESLQATTTAGMEAQYVQTSPCAGIFSFKRTDNP